MTYEEMLRFQLGMALFFTPLVIILIWKTLELLHMDWVATRAREKQEEITDAPT